MTPEELTTQLRDIHLPEAVSWWPLAPGWYILIVGILTLIALVLFAMFRFRKNRWRRQALQELERLYLNHEQNEGVDNSDSDFAASLNALLKRVVRLRYPETRCNPLSGETWVETLHQLRLQNLRLPKNGQNFDFSDLANCQYQKSKTLDRRFHYEQIREWIKACL
ncbi:hypothetical protein OLMES_2531 [Oleiphilus messinensis]|uniref:DUF4381 domain-containing protein n=1 Tax=Oleiphilus messinensis TaxID=141451 RepID=A0A1Y0IAZ0_9GAMM|nr:DUF4381 domain-containing protein [Oleiphilus messinensis]ARU56584.1 hypothetical protein OLMES_2531 [Oleiphilus messinensis]